MMKTHEIANYLELTYGSVNYYLYKYNIRKNGVHIKINKDELINLYIDKRLTLMEIANYFNCCYATIIKYINKYNLHRKNGNDNSKYFDIVSEYYLKDKKSIRMIATLLGLPASRIRQILIQAGIKRRNKSESQQCYNYKYKEFDNDWNLMSNKLIKRCRRYFSNHISNTIKKEKCEDCGSTNNLHVHHIIAMSLIIQEIKNENPNVEDDDLFNIIIKDNRFLSKDNLKVVCEKCHYTKYHPYLGYQIVNQQPSLENKEGSTTTESITKR